MTPLDLGSAHAEHPPIIAVDPRAVTPVDAQFCVRHGMALAQIAWVGFRHSAVVDPLIEAVLSADDEASSRKRSPDTLDAFAAEVFPNSRSLTSAEAAEIDAAILKHATPIGRTRRY